MKEIWSVAAITFKEGIRNRALFGILLLALVLLVANLLVSGMLMQQIGKAAVDIALSAVALSGLLVVLFVGINLMAKDLDKKTIFMVLSRPLSRAQYIWGKFLGLSLVLLVTLTMLGGAALLSILLVKLNNPTYFERFSWGAVLLALGSAAFGLEMLLALSMLFASFSTTSFITLIYTTVAYLAGHVIGDVKALVEAPQAVGIEVSVVTLRTVRAAYYLIPNLSLFDLKQQAAHGLPIDPVYLGWSLLYGISYILLALTAAALIFNRREFP